MDDDHPSSETKNAVGGVGPYPGRHVFARVLAGVDGSEEALEAARQAAVVQDAEGRLTLLSVWDVAPAMIGGTGTRVPEYFDEGFQRSRAEQAVEVARDFIAPYSAASGKVVRGSVPEELIREIECDLDTLVVVGSSGLGRRQGIIAGSVATEIIHKAPCSVMVARKPADGFLRRIVVGVDGSPESAAAYAAGRYLAARFGGSVTPIVAWGGKDVDERMIAAITAGGHEDAKAPPNRALVTASVEADLVVVGSRGLHGLRSLGSVSERVAHEAACSTLIVREPAWQRVADELGN